MMWRRQSTPTPLPGWLVVKGGVVSLLSFCFLKTMLLIYLEMLACLSCIISLTSSSACLSLLKYNYAQNVESPLWSPAVDD